MSLLSVAAVITVIVLNRPNATDLYKRCDSLLDSRQYQEALEFCNKAIQIKPDYQEAWFQRGYALDELKRYKEAIAAYDQAIQLAPKNYVAWNNRGVSLQKLGQYYNFEALASYEEAIEINPGFQIAIANKYRLTADIQLGSERDQVLPYKSLLERRMEEGSR